MVVAHVFCSMQLGDGTGPLQYGQASLFSDLKQWEQSIGGVWASEVGLSNNDVITSGVCSFLILINSIYHKLKSNLNVK